MKILFPIVLSFTAVLMLQGCGSSSKKAEMALTTPTPMTPKAVHSIQPDKVVEYVETFKNQQAALELQFEGVKYAIELVDFSTDEKVVVAKYEKGYILIGFDFDKEEPTDLFTLIESDLDFEQANESPDRVLASVNVKAEEEDEQAVYSGTVMDTNTEDVFNVRLVFNESLISGGTSQVEVNGTIATVNGDLGTRTYIQITDLINSHPEVKTLVLQQINGSNNDAINMHTGRLVRNAQLITMVEETSNINSGGVDLYASGFERVYTEGAKVGVHSWCCVDGKGADKLAKDHSAHGAQLTFFREMLGAELGPEFYFFTLEAASFDGIHQMTKAELDKFLLKL